jgi:hypothetical protein
METKNTKIAVEGYGDMLSKIKDMELVEYQESGHYQGDYVAVLRDRKDLCFYFGYYGSCSGCDWLEAEKDWSTNEVDYTAALEYCNQAQLKYRIPELLWLTLTKTQRELFIDEDFSEAEEMKEKIVGLLTSKEETKI